MFNKSSISISSGRVNLTKFIPSDFIRRKAAPWVYFEPEETTTPVVPPPYIGISISADNVLTLCGASVPLVLSYVLDPPEYDGEVNIFWEQRTGSPVTIDDPYSLSPVITYNSEENTDFIIRAYIDRGTPQEIFDDANIIRTPLDTSSGGIAVSSSVDQSTINRSGVAVANASDIMGGGIAAYSTIRRYLNEGGISVFRGTEFDPNGITAYPAVIDQSGNTLEPYYSENIPFMQISWDIPITPRNIIIYEINVYENNILYLNTQNKIKSVVVPLATNSYSVSVSYLNTDTNAIITTHPDLHATASQYIGGVRSGYSIDQYVQDKMSGGIAISSSVDQSTINRSGVAVANASDIMSGGIATYSNLNDVIIVRLNGISIGT